MSAPVPLLFPFGAMERMMLKLQEEWGDFRPTDLRTEQRLFKTCEKTLSGTTPNHII